MLMPWSPSIYTLMLFVGLIRDSTRNREGSPLISAISLSSISFIWVSALIYYKRRRERPRSLLFAISIAKVMKMGYSFQIRLKLSTRSIAVRIGKAIVNPGRRHPALPIFVLWNMFSTPYWSTWLISWSLNWSSRFILPAAVSRNNSVKCIPACRNRCSSRNRPAVPLPIPVLPPVAANRAPGII